MKIGCHVGMSGKDMMLGSVREAVSYGADTFMLYTGTPQNTRRKDIEQLRIPEAHELMRENEMQTFVVHAPYIINLANSVKPETFEIAVDFLALELERTATMGSDILILHPGSHVGAGVDAGVRQIVKGINSVLTRDTKVKIALETMAGKGSEIGRSFEELAAIYDGVVCNDKLRVCFDTCHVSDAGYDLIHGWQDVKERFDRVLGKEQIAVFHMNDSKNVPGARKDRHENFGYGQIGFDALMQIIRDPEFEEIPKILETPYVKDPENAKKSYPPYRYEIAMIREGVFDPAMREKVWEQYRK